MHHTELALIELGLRSRSVDFSKILAQVDGMIKVLGEEQKDDDNTKSYCDKEIGKTTKEIKSTSEALESSEAAIEEMTATAAPDLIPGTSIAAMQTQLYAQLNEYTTDDASAAPPPPPATWDAYQKKDGKSNGVI